ncbi:MAG: M56 family metallopeptidase [Lachnospiraceae bacterium]|nr:M56 family metallopeptidase [Lachnospiraceae bacterium]
MEQILSQIWHNSISVTVLIVAVIVIRAVFQKMPKWSMCLLWLIVATRLICPIQIESDFSMNPAGSFTSGIGTLEQKIQNNLNGRQTLKAEKSFVEQEVDGNEVVTLKVALDYKEIALKIWIAGMIVMTTYAIISYVLLKRKVRTSMKIESNIYLCDYIEGPFVLGMVRPKIYLPSSLKGEDREYVIKHERMHLKRKDYLWKPLGFLVLIVYWFQPLCWIAYVLFCKDIEYACDEKAIKGELDYWRKEYCQVLLKCSIQKKYIAACPVAFGEISVKERVKSIMNYKKTSILIVTFFIIICAGATVCFATSQKTLKFDTSKVKVDYGKSEIYSKSEMNEAINIIYKKFSSWNVGELQSIEYSTDSAAKDEFNVKWLQSLLNARREKDEELDEELDECILFKSSFHTTKDAIYEGFNEDADYVDWQWWLGRSKGGEWKLISWGY